MIHIIKRGDQKKWQGISVRLIAVIAALLIASIFVLIAGVNPLKLYVGMITGALGTFYRFSQTLQEMVPLLILSLGVSVAFKMHFWNIGAEGQFLMGAVGATLMVRVLPPLPMTLMILIMAIMSIAFGAIWLLIPAFFKSMYNTNETLFTLMMNYIALEFVTALQYDYWKDPAANGMPKIAGFPDYAMLPNLGSFGSEILFAILAVIIAEYFLYHSKTGFEISVLGVSQNTAKYAGINVKKITIIGAAVSGGLCGLVGMLQTAGVSGTLSAQITGGLGFTAIIVAWLSNLKTPFIIMTSFLFAVLIQGGSAIQTAFQIQASLANLIQATILFCILASEFFLEYRIVFGKKVKN